MKGIQSFFLPMLLQMFVLHGFAQSETDSLVSKFNQYRSNVLHEKIYVHTDRSVYLTGEMCWFRIYYVDASLHKTLDVSKVAYVEILDKENKPVLQSKVALNERGGEGSIFFPSSLSSGNYMLRVYTNWMKNFNPELFFHQAITIINPFTRLGIVSPQALQKHDVQFFPEGGNLVAGIKNTVAFRVVDPSGKGIAFKGALVDNQNDTILRFQPFQFGIGRFEFTPTAGVEYRAVIKESQRKTEYKFPASQPDGFSMQVRDTLAGKIGIAVQSGLKQDSRIHVLIHTRHMIKVAESRMLENGQAVIHIDRSLLGEGISHIMIFNSNGTPVCERLIFNPPDRSLSIAARISNVKPHKREKLSVDISTSLLNSHVSTDMSVAVYRIDSLDTSTPTLAEYLLLTSDLAGNVESPAWYFEDMLSPERKFAIDNLMLTHGWRRFRWGDVLTKQRSFAYLPEHGGHLITGTIKNESDQPVKRVLTFASIPGKQVNLYSSSSNSNGEIRFETKDFTGPNQVYIQTNQSEYSYHVEIENPFSVQKSTYQVPAFNFSPALKNSLEQRSIHMQVHNIFYEMEINRISNVHVDSSAFFGKPDEVYKLDDYTRFPTMEEVLREYVSGVLVRKNSDGFYFMTKNKNTNEVFTEPPLVLVDGIPIFDADNVMKLDPLQVQKLELVTQKFYLGPAVFNGIVSFRTYQHDLGKLQQDQMVVVSYEGMQPVREFFSPMYETQGARESTKADARTLLFWSPFLQSDQSGKARFDFFTSDLEGKYKIVIQGLSTDGKAGYSETLLEVKD